MTSWCQGLRWIPVQGLPGVPGVGSIDPVVSRLNKLSIKKGDVSSALAWDDLTGMRLDAGQIIEARGKEMDYVHKMRVWRKIPRKPPRLAGGKSSKQDGLTPTQETTISLYIGVVWWEKNLILAK